jgi:hypothetical protein
MSDIIIDGEITSFPVFGETESDRLAIRGLYLETFEKPAPESMSYLEVRLAIETGIADEDE